jgi:hypothetical protein
MPNRRLEAARFSWTGGNHSVPCHFTCAKSDFIGVDLASLGLPPPSPYFKSTDRWFWHHHRFPPAGLIAPGRSQCGCGSLAASFVTRATTDPSKLHPI